MFNANKLRYANVAAQVSWILRDSAGSKITDSSSDEVNKLVVAYVLGFLLLGAVKIRGLRRVEQYGPPSLEVVFNALWPKEGGHLRSIAFSLSENDTTDAAGYGRYDYLTLAAEGKLPTGFSVCVQSARKAEARTKFEEKTTYLRGRRDRALPDLSDAVRGAGWLDEARAIERLGHWKQLREFASKQVRAHPAYAAAWVLVGVSAIKLGDSTGAIDACIRATQLCPDAAEAWAHLAMAYMAAEDLTKCAEACGAARRINPRNKIALRALGWVATAYKRPSDAIRIYRYLVQAEPEANDLWFCLGVACLESGARGQAVDVYEHLMTTNRQVAVQLLSLIRAMT